MIRQTTKIIHEGKYALEIMVDLVYGDESWSPTMSLNDARKLEAARHALRAGDIAEASTYGHVFELLPVSA